MQTRETFATTIQERIEPVVKVADRNPVIGPDNTPGRRRRALTINGRFERIRRCNRRGGSCRFFQEIPACFHAGQ